MHTLTVDDADFDLLGEWLWDFLRDGEAVANSRIDVSMRKNSLRETRRCADSLLLYR